MPSNELYIVGGILLLGFIVCLFLISRSNRKSKSPEHHEVIEKPEFEEEIEEKKKRKYNFPIGNLIGTFVVILVVISLFPTIMEQVKKVQIDLNVTSNVTSVVDGMSGIGTSDTLIGLVVIFFALAVAIIPIGIVFSSLRSGGVI